VIAPAGPSSRVCMRQVCADVHAQAKCVRMCMYAQVVSNVVAVVAAVAVVVAAVVVVVL